MGHSPIDVVVAPAAIQCTSGGAVCAGHKVEDRVTIHTPNIHLHVGHAREQEAHCCSDCCWWTVAVAGACACVRVSAARSLNTSPRLLRTVIVTTRVVAAEVSSQKSSGPSSAAPEH